MRTNRPAIKTKARYKPMPVPRADREHIWSALGWLVFCAVMVVAGLFLTPEVGAIYAAEDLNVILADVAAATEKVVELALPGADETPTAESNGITKPR